MSLLNSTDAQMNQDIIRRAGEIVEKNTGAGTYCVLVLLITLFDRILLTIGGRQRQSIAPA